MVQLVSRILLVKAIIIFILSFVSSSHAKERNNCTLLDDAFYGAMEKGDDPTIEAMIKALDEVGGETGNASDEQCAKAIEKVSKALSYAKSQELPDLSETSKEMPKDLSTAKGTIDAGLFQGNWIAKRASGKRQVVAKFQLIQDKGASKGSGDYVMKQGVCSPPEEFCEWAEAFGDLISVSFKGQTATIEVNPTADMSDGHTLKFTLNKNNPNQGFGSYSGLPGSFKTFKIKVERVKEQSSAKVAKKTEPPQKSSKPKKKGKSKSSVCTAYVSHVMGVINEYERLGCFEGGEMFHKDRKAHLEMCQAMSTVERKRILRQEYDAKLVQCKAKNSPHQTITKKDSCQTYANKVMGKINTYEQRGCQFGGELFHKNRQAHFDYCTPMTAGDQRDIYAIYDAKLAQCPAELKCSNPRHETLPECKEMFGESGKPEDIHDLPGFVAVLPVTPNVNLNISIFGSNKQEGVGGPGQQIVKACSDYALLATANWHENKRRQCGNSGPLWSPSKQVHFDACIKGGRPFVINATNVREGKLRQCIGALMCITPSQQKSPYCLALQPKPEGFGGADPQRLAQCRNYERDAMKIASLNLKHKCGFKGDHWHTDGVKHFNTCVTGDPIALKVQLNKRNLDVNACRFPVNHERKACEQPLDGIMKFVAESKQLKCGFTGPLWSSDRTAQLDYCEKQVKEKGYWAVDAMGLERVRLLHQCRDKAQQSNNDCRLFGKKAAEQFQKSQQLKCNFKGKIWNKDVKYHDDRCRNMALKSRDWEAAIRAKALQNCEKKSGNKAAFCAQYGKQAAQQNHQNKTNNCGFKTGTIWHDDAKKHEVRCIKASIKGAKGLSDLRKKALGRCAAQFCMAYQKTAREHTRLNKRKKCGFKGNMWRIDPQSSPYEPNRGRFFRECMNLTQANALNLQKQREEALKACRKKHTSGNACAKLKVEAEGKWARATAKSKNTQYLMRHYKKYQRLILDYQKADKAVKSGNNENCKKLIGKMQEF